MKNKAPLALMEILVMILVFAVAAAVCLTSFVWADKESKNMELQNDAVIIVQNTAEALKFRKGNVDLALEDTGYDPAEEPFVKVKILHETPDGLGGAKVSAYNMADEEIFSVDVYWQTPLKGGYADE